MKRLFLLGIAAVLLFGGCRRHPVADFTMTPNPVYVDEKVYLANISVNASSCYWQFGDMDDYSWFPEPISFSTPGEKRISLTVYSGRAENTMTKYLYVKERPTDGGGSSGSGGSSEGSQQLEGYKDFKYINTHKYPYKVTQTRDGVEIGTYSIPANTTKVIKCKCSTTEVHKIVQSSGYFDHPNNINMNPFTVDCSNVSQGGYYYYTIKCNTSKIKYVNGNSVPYRVEITCQSNNTNYSVTVQGNSSGTFVAEAGCEYTVKFTQESGYALWPSISTYTVKVDCGYTYTRNAPTNIKGEAESLNSDVLTEDVDSEVGDETGVDDADLCIE